MKPPSEWNESDIISLIDTQTPESLTLEYKSCDALKKDESSKKEISKDVSSFANSAGGTIIYGVKEDNNKIFNFDNGYDPNDRQGITKEWLDQVINSNIHPRINGLIIKQISLETKNPGYVIYAVVIPQATLRAPHQASDKKYYKRSNARSVAMEDYEIRDVMRRTIAPDLFLVIDLIRNHDDNVTTKGKKLCIPCVSSKTSIEVMLDIAICNESSEPANYALITIGLDPKINILDASGMSLSGLGRIENNSGKFIKDGNVLESNWSINNNNLPIFKEQGLLFKKLFISIPVFPDFTNVFKNVWKISSPGMFNSRRFELILTTSQNVHTLTLNFPED
jgi:hypothetical protein